MDFKVLKSFLTVCETGNITRAAEQIHISQPALTRQIKDLEEELECKLFDRSTRSLSLTEKGWQFQKRASELIALADQTRKEMAVRPGNLQGTVKIGVVESSVMKLLTSKIKNFQKNYPDVQIHLHSADGDDLRALLDSEKVDLAVFIEPVETVKYMRVKIPVNERWGVLVNASNPIALQNSVRTEELLNMKLILPRRFLVIDEIESWTKASGQRLNVVATINLLSNGLELVKQGLGNLVCIEGAFTNRPSAEFKFLPFEPNKFISHVLARKKNKTLDKPAELFWKEFSK